MVDIYYLYTAEAWDLNYGCKKGSLKVTFISFVENRPVERPLAEALLPAIFHISAGQQIVALLSRK